MKKSALLLLIFTVVHIFSQQAKVEYLYIRSNIATLTETLYVNNNRSISNQDSIVKFKGNDDVTHRESNTGFAAQFLTVKDGNQNKMVQSVSIIGDKKEVIYLVDDEMKNLDWKINQGSTNKILGYQCVEAESVYRGRPVVAFFAPDIKIDAGPYKFSGLPELILEVYVKNLSYYRWKAISVDLKNSEKISFQPLYNNLNKINLKDYVLLGDQQKAVFFKSVNEVPSGSYKTVVNPDRSTIEKVYEWEQ